MDYKNKRSNWELLRISRGLLYKNTSRLRQVNLGKYPTKGFSRKSRLRDIQAIEKLENHVFSDRQIYNVSIITGKIIKTW